MSVLHEYFMCRWVDDEGGRIADTHVFSVSHDCGGLTGVRFSISVEKRRWCRRAWMFFDFWSGGILRLRSGSACLVISVDI